jgi:hypothetical protein
MINIKYAFAPVSACLAFWLLAGLVTAQETGTPETREWGKQAGPFRLSISADRGKYAAGERIRLTVVLKNVSDHPARMGRSSFRPYMMDVRLPTPAWIPWKPVAPLTAYGDQMLNPKHPFDASIAGGEVEAGHQGREEVEINQIYAMSTPGEYEITFSCRQWDSSPENPARASWVTVVSNRLLVTVSAAAQ